MVVPSEAAPIYCVLRSICKTVDFMWNSQDVSTRVLKDFMGEGFYRVVSLGLICCYVFFLLPGCFS